MKTKFIQVQNNWFSNSSKEAPAYKKSAKASEFDNYVQ